MSAPVWWWCSFAAPDRFLGVAVVRAHDELEVPAVCARLSCNPGGEMVFVEVPARFGAPPPQLDHKLVTDREELDRLTHIWHGCGVERVNSNLEPQES